MLIVQIYMHVQKELIAYKILSQHFGKDVSIKDGKVLVALSKYQQHQIDKMDTAKPEKGALAAFTERERSKSISLFESQ